MDCRLVFYSARKTSFCERALKKSFLELDLKLLKTSFAVKDKQLVDFLSESFSGCDLVFVIGGLSLNDERNAKTVISSAVDASSVDDIKRLNNESGDDGYVLRAKNQFLIMLPDEPSQIENIMQGAIGKYIKIGQSVSV